MTDRKLCGILLLFLKITHASYTPSDDQALTVHFNNDDGLIEVRTHWTGENCEGICSYRVRINTYGFGEQVVVAFGDQQDGLSSSNYHVEPGMRYLVEVCRVDSVGGHVIPKQKPQQPPSAARLNVHYAHQMMMNFGIMLKRIGDKAKEDPAPKPDCEYKQCLPRGTDYPCSDITAEDAVESGMDAVFLTEIQL